jgi:hypothetical protein
VYEKSSFYGERVLREVMVAQRAGASQKAWDERR